MTGQDSSICSGCGYDLSGIGRRGHCPECGQAFNVSTRHGLTEPTTERYRRGERLARRLGMLALLALALMALACGGFFAVVSESWSPIAMAGVAALLLGLGALSQYLSGKDEG